MPPTLTFETKVYEKDWRYLLLGGRLETMLERCDRKFDHRVLHINNVADPCKVLRHAEAKVRAGVIDDVVIVEEHASQALEHFQICRESFQGGYYYSIAELVALFRCQTDFLLHFSSDACLAPNSPDWISPAMDLFERHPEVSVANPAWNHQFDEVRSEAESELDGFWLSRGGFSDQCYLVRAPEFRAPIYGERHPASERYPKYGGELFEKRVDSYLRARNRCRITHGAASYEHVNFPKHPVKRAWKEFRETTAVGKAVSRILG